MPSNHPDHHSTPEHRIVLQALLQALLVAVLVAILAALRSGRL
jgi:hypothetical protein